MIFRLKFEERNKKKEAKELAAFEALQKQIQETES